MNSKKISSVKAFITRHVYAKEANLGEKSFTLLCFFLMVAGGAGSLITFLIGAPLLSALIIFAVFLVSLLIFFVIRKNKQFRLGSIIVLGMVNLVILPVVYFTGGGFQSGMLHWFA